MRLHLNNRKDFTVLSADTFTLFEAIATRNMDIVDFDFAKLAPQVLGVHMSRLVDHVSPSGSLHWKRYLLTQGELSFDLHPHKVDFWLSHFLANQEFSMGCCHIEPSISTSDTLDLLLQDLSLVDSLPFKLNFPFLQVFGVLRTC